MTIILTGGGSGGHITPILAVASELKKAQPGVRLVYVGQKGESLADVPAEHKAIDDVRFVYAGKFRRYHGGGWQQAFDIKTQILNLRDAIRVLIGIWQSYWLMRRLRPSIVFTRGGFVSVPVALGAHLCGVPYITHDSDSTPSLANRIIARWAELHAVALPAELYPYPQAKTRMIGVPVSGEYQTVDTKLQHLYREEIGLDHFEWILLVTGGGNGAEKLNSIIAECAGQLLLRYPKLAIVHLSGRTLEAKLQTAYDTQLPIEIRKRVIVRGFVADLYRYSGAADIIIARGGATGLAEFALQQKACIIIPAPQLAWQTHHAEALAKQNAVKVLLERQQDVNAKLVAMISELLESANLRRELATNLGKLGKPTAAHDLAMLLLEKAKRK